MGKRDANLRNRNSAIVMPNLSTSLVHSDRVGKVTSFRMPVTKDVHKSNWLNFNDGFDAYVTPSKSGRQDRVDLYFPNPDVDLYSQEYVSIKPKELKDSYYARCQETVIPYNIADDRVGQMVYFAQKNVGAYRVLVEGATGSKIKGLVVDFNSCYSHEHIVVPKICRKEFDLADDDIASTDTVQFYEPHGDEIDFEQSAAKQQEQFLRNMVDVPKGASDTYLSVTFDITEIKDGSDAGEAGIYCDMTFQKLCGFEPEGEYQNPDVVESSFYADKLSDMEIARSSYSSSCGDMLDSTLVTYNLVRETADNRTQKVCSVTAPYKAVRVKGFDVFATPVPTSMKQCVQDTMTFMSNHKYQSQVQTQTTPKKVPTEFEDIVEKAAMNQNMDDLGTYYQGGA